MSRFEDRDNQDNRSSGNRSGGSRFGGGQGNRSGSNRSGGGQGNRSGGSRFGGPRRFDDGPKEMHKTTCTECKGECEVPFKPTQGKPVYCSDCFKKHKRF